MRNYFPEQFRKDWDESKEINWVVGYITHDGAIIAEAVHENITHYPLYVAKWRWDVAMQNWCEHTQFTLTPEQQQEVEWWLEEAGWKSRGEISQ